MKCNDAEKWILLKDADELEKSQAEALETHINTCKNCQRFQAMLTVAQNNITADAAPSDAVIQNILREARKQAPAPKQSKIIYWKPLLAVAASAVIALGLFFTKQTTGESDVGLKLTLTDTQLLDFNDQIISIMYDSLSEDDLAFNFMMTYDG